MTDDIFKQELRSGWLGIEKPYQALDALGVALGSYFIFAGATGKAPPWLTISLGAVMVWIHSRRFLYAPNDQAGLVRLLQSLDVTPADLERIKGEISTYSGANRGGN